jgi:ribosomal protein S18 acetylase RimI-like enzyme
VLKGVLAQAKDKADDGVNPKWRVRLMTEADVDEVLRIQRLCYEPEYRELPESYVGRIRLYPQGNVIVEVPVSASSADNDYDTSEGDSSSDSDNDDDNDVNNDCDNDDDDDDSEDCDNDNDYVEPVKQVKNQVTRYSPSGSPRCEDDTHDLHSVKKRRVGKPTVTLTTKWRMAGYIQAQPFLREGINDVNDLIDLERWLADHPTMDQAELDPQRDVIYVHEIAMDPAFRGQGLTTPLTDYVQQLTADEGFVMITLVSLGPALGFWKRNGFTMCRELDYGGHICYYMEKPLADQPLADR